MTFPMRKGSLPGSKRRRGATLAPLLLLAAYAFAHGAATAQSYPDRPVRLVVGLAPGGTQDVIARTVAKQLAVRLGQAVIVDNRDGANGIIAATIVAKAAPDGYTLLHSASAFIINPSIVRKLPYDVFRDFVPVTIVASGVGYLLIVHPSVPAHNLKEFLALARDKNSKLAYGSAGVGNNLHLAAEYFNLRAGTHLMHVPYKGGAPAVTALLGGDIQAMFVPPTVAVVQQLKAGRLRALAFTGSARWPLLPDVPTIAEAAIPGYQVSGTWHGWLAPANTPHAIVTRLETEARAALQVPAIHESIVAGGYDPVGSTSAEFAKIMRTEYAQFAEAVRAAGIKPE